MQQAYDAYARFGFDSVSLIFPTDTTLNRQLAENIKKRMPAHLGLLNDASQGHNVVVDGYNTDELFHFNFGWGGGSNGWYSMPPEDIAYDLTIIEAVALNINEENIHVGIPKETSTASTFSIFPNPSDGLFSIKGLSSNENCTIRIFNPNGIEVYQKKGNSNSSEIQIQLSELKTGLYFIQLTDNTGQTSTQKLLVR
jgi:Secretion system C-terminal sorting domain/Peptidase C10 family